MINSTNDELHVLGGLMHHPQYLSESDKYALMPSDFSDSIYKYIFKAIYNIYQQSGGTFGIEPIDIESALSTNDAAAKLLKDGGGIELLTDMRETSSADTFGYYYNSLKKWNLLRQLQKAGIKTDDIYCESPQTAAQYDVNKAFDSLSIATIIENKKKSLIQIEGNFNCGQESTRVSKITDNLRQVLKDAKEGANIGEPIQGELFNEVCAGARKGKFYLRSAGSGVGKTRQAVGDACLLAYPIRFSITENRWVQEGGNQHIMFIATEQDEAEIQRMVLSYLSGVNENLFTSGIFEPEEEKRIEQAIELMETFEENFIVARMPNPTIAGVKALVQESNIRYNLDAVFYDYIFIGPSLIREFQGVNLRNDEVLLMFATALKELAVDNNLFIMSSTQVNAAGDNPKELRNESAIAGGRATVNKADIGVICARPTTEELAFLEPYIAKYGKEPNMVTDVYKVRAGRFTQVRIWSMIDLGTLRKEDLFMTDNRMNLKNDVNVNYNISMDWNNEDYQRMADIVKELNGD